MRDIHRSKMILRLLLFVSLTSTLTVVEGARPARSLIQGTKDGGVLADAPVQTSWVPTKWLLDLESLDISKNFVAADSEEKCNNKNKELQITLKTLQEENINANLLHRLHGEQMAICDLKLKGAKLEEENMRLKQEARVQELKLKHSQETFTLMQEKQAALDETSRYKRQVQDLSVALESLKKEIREDYTTKIDDLRTEIVELKNHTKYLHQSDSISQVHRNQMKIESDDQVKKLIENSTTLQEMVERKLNDCTALSTDLQNNIINLNSTVLATNQETKTIKEKLSSLDNEQTKIKKTTDKMRLSLENATATIQNLKKIIKVTKDLIKLGDKFYYFGKDKLQKSWHDAQAHCRSLGLELISLETKEENNLVNAHRLKHFGGNHNMWLGGTDEGHEGRWMWSGTQQNLGFTDWYPSQPYGGTNENCMVICTSSYNGSWCDVPCSGTRYYACELHEV